MTTTTSTQTMHARSPEDVLAAVPLVLGFVPDDSVVMLTYGAPEPFHARVDLPRTGRDRRSAADTLLEPVLRHGVQSAFFVLYTTDPRQARSCGRVLVRTFTRHGVDVVDLLRSNGRCWFPVPLDGPVITDDGTPYDVTSHHFTAEAVASGRVIRASRAELAATVAVDPRAVHAVSAASRGLCVRDPAAEGDWTRRMVARLADCGEPPDPATTARLLAAVSDPAARDEILAGVDRQQAERQVPVWSALVRAAPAGLVGPAASVLAFLAWLSGDGALAWCALDRASEDQPPCSLAEVVAKALERALPPSVWERR
jgi:hypothetical protein